MKVIGVTERQVLCVNIMGCIDEGDWSYRASILAVCGYKLLHNSLFQTKETSVRENVSKDLPPKQNAGPR
jgi:hypothetical protein